MCAKLWRHIISLLGSIALIVLISGCTTNPYTSESQASRTGVGAGIGAAGGALVGQLIGGNTEATLIGAGLGAAVGGVAGNYMDRQAAELRQQLQGTGVKVVRAGNDIRLIMPENITFPINGSDIKPQFYSTLNSVALVLKHYNKTMIKVAGYTDSTGSAQYNQSLSERRAQSVASYLASQGIIPNRFSVLGYGKRYPIASNATVAGRAQNRRVEITIHQI